GGTADRNRSHWSTSKTPSYTKSVSWQHHQKVVTLIDDNIREEILRPEWIAGETGMSVRSLYRMFADKGLVVAQYIRNRRLDFCADAIRHAADDEKLAGIGFHWGFSDQSHFSTVFKQRFGMTPGEYRRKFR
uniref:helix-turn-helix domain-containing protein n=10 Tax=Escherichia coli TaxID=562 RepID=UPI001FCEC1FA